MITFRGDIRTIPESWHPQPSTTLQPTKSGLISWSLGVRFVTWWGVGRSAQKMEATLILDEDKTYRTMLWSAVEGRSLDSSFHLNSVSYIMITCKNQNKMSHKTRTNFYLNVSLPLLCRRRTDRIKLTLPYIRERLDFWSRLKLFSSDYKSCREFIIPFMVLINEN